MFCEDRNGDNGCHCDADANLVEILRSSFGKPFRSRIFLMGVEPFVKDLGKLMFDRCQLE